MEKEMNFFDLCVACGRAIGRCCKACWDLFAHMLRLTYRYWWVVITLVVLVLAGAWFYTRPANLTYKVNAVALLNGASIQQFEQAFAPLSSGKMLPEDAAVKPFLKERKVWRFETFRVVDCLNDGVADYVDFKHKSLPTDTVKVQMQDRLCLQFRIKQRDLEAVLQIEEAVLAFLNANEAMQRSYETYIANLRNEAVFNHEQALKLDSLTSSYYFYAPSAASPMNYSSNGVNFYGNRTVELFLEDIYEQQQHMQQVDYRLQLATAPVALENHFVASPAPVNGRIKCLVIFFLFGWIIGCLIAEAIDQRKAICAWLKQ